MRLLWGDGGLDNSPIPSNMFFRNKCNEFSKLNHNKVIGEGVSSCYTGPEERQKSRELQLDLQEDNVRATHDNNERERNDRCPPFLPSHTFVNCHESLRALLHCKSIREKHRL